ncbi:hypothetical protein RHGRI_026765 [Rhododendron griersonianum]|uniref:Uncharacterized protein n=1 Tax=Rhododendron griersonianum TaxID=479676 RepID=A0AAV6ITV0_9ERIC|nr:hypothetical protein RHGRI_026765 [Rhododendron griersonianum]
MGKAAVCVAAALRAVGQGEDGRSPMHACKGILVRNGVVIFNSYGTAFLVEQNIAATNAHTCSKQFEIRFRGLSRGYHWIKAAVYGRFSDQETPFRLTILAVNTQTDTCLLGLPRGMMDPELHFCAKLCLEMPLLGQSLFFIGNPGIPFCIKRGMFSCVRTPKELLLAGLRFTAMKVDALEFEGVAPPVFDRFRRVFAMVFGGNSLVDEDPGALSMYAFPAFHIKQLLDWIKGSHRSVFVFNDGYDEEYDDFL